VGLSAHAGAFFLWLLGLCLFTLLGSGLGLIVGAAIPNMQQAITISVIFILSSIILGTSPLVRANWRWLIEAELTG
jgi:multisubunit Na+/H+ antiporter MnhE subunit